jgi:hypothetical protein
VAVSHNGAYVTYKRVWQAPGYLDFLCPPAECTSPSPSEIGERPKRSTLPTRSNAGDPSTALSPGNGNSSRSAGARRNGHEGFGGSRKRGEEEEEARWAGAGARRRHGQRASTGTVVATWSWSGASGPSVPAGSGRVLVSCSARSTRGVHRASEAGECGAHDEVDGNGDHDAGVIA